METDLDINTNEIPSPNSSPEPITDWQQDSAGNEYKQDASGVRMYRIGAVDRLVPLGQYFDTRLYRKYETVTLDDFKVKYDRLLKRNKKYALGYVRRYQEIKADGKGYYLHSKEPGSGKTMLACAILNGLSAKYGLTTQAITTIDFVKRMKATFSDEDISEESVINPMLAVDVLLLDDCGSEKHSEWVDEQLYHIVNSRLNDNKPTFYTANYSIDKLPYHKRIKSRINAMTAQVPMPEKDIRAMVSRDNDKDFLQKISE